FFQAEDGIRDDLVTGVQTCALPIYEDGFAGERKTGARQAGDTPDREADAAEAEKDRALHPRLYIGLDWRDHGSSIGDWFADAERSEERRVGKGWRAGVRGGEWKKKW